MVSLWKHAVAIPAHRYSGAWDHWFKLSMAGGAESGDWCDHNAGWWRAATSGAKKQQILWLQARGLASACCAGRRSVSFRFLGEEEEGICAG